MATQPLNPDKYRVTLTQLANMHPETLTANHIQTMIDASIKPFETRLIELELKYSTETEKSQAEDSESIENELTYYHGRRKMNDSINRVFFLNRDSKVHFIFNAVEDVAVRTILGWRLWQPYQLLDLYTYTDTVRLLGNIVDESKIYSTLDEIETAALDLIHKYKLMKHNILTLE